jgi:hypothetical protein
LTMELRQSRLKLGSNVAVESVYDHPTRGNLLTDYLNNPWTVLDDLFFVYGRMVQNKFGPLIAVCKIHSWTNV